MPLLCVGALSVSAAAARAAAIKTQLVKTAGGWQLLRNGQPYFIKGAGGTGSMTQLKKDGGNSVRTWGADGIGPQLKEAQKLGLSVTVGIWLGQVQQGFNYNNPAAVKAQYETVKRVILKYRNNPAVLMWGLGNETDGYGAKDNPAVWKAINQLGAMCHKLDPNHPTMTVIAEIGGDRVQLINKLCPAIDIIGINSYGGLVSLASRYRAMHPVKPYVVTEFGPPGQWESPKNSFGVPVELTSTAKAAFYKKGYEASIISQKGLCLGSYAFNWGYKNEATATWYGMFLPDGRRLGPVNAMTKLWSGHSPKILCPDLTSIEVLGPTSGLKGGSTIHAQAVATDPSGKKIHYKWVLRSDSGNYAITGYTPKAGNAGAVNSKTGDVTVRLPKYGGIYRLYSYVYDNHKNAAVGNIPLKVAGPKMAFKAPHAKLPFVLYGPKVTNGPYTASGWMGDAGAMHLDLACHTRPHDGKRCIKISYTAKGNWGGMVWQSPVNNWGKLKGGYNITGAKTLSFWARGKAGGEVVNFGYGLVGRGQRYYDTSKGSLKAVTLHKKWTHYTISLKGKSLRRIISGFYFTLAGQGKPVTFYLDDIQYQK